MSKKSVTCPAILKNGLSCSYKGSPEYNGYCGIHKGKQAPSSTAVKHGRDERLTQLLGAGASLVFLMEKAIEYLPTLIEVLLKASGLAFVEKTGIPAEHKSNSRGEELIKFNMAPKQLPKSINDSIEHQNWQILANELAYSFDVEINSGNIPQKLLEKIMIEKINVGNELRILGYTPSEHTVEKPVFSRIIELTDSTKKA